MSVVAASARYLPRRRAYHRSQGRGSLMEERILPVPPSEAVPANRVDRRAATSASFLRACVLLLLHECPAHGYELLDRLKRFGFDAGDSGWLYRTLRSLEGERLCVSAWEPSSAGPRRRTYYLTGRGDEALASSVDTLRASVRAMESYLERYVVASPTTQVVDPWPPKRRAVPE